MNGSLNFDSQKIARGERRQTRFFSRKKGPGHFDTSNREIFHFLSSPRTARNAKILARGTSIYRIAIATVFCNRGDRIISRFRIGSWRAGIYKPGGQLPSRQIFISFPRTRHSYSPIPPPPPTLEIAIAMSCPISTVFDTKRKRFRFRRIDESGGSGGGDVVGERR